MDVVAIDTLKNLVSEYLEFKDRDDLKEEEIEEMSELKKEIINILTDLLNQINNS